MVICDKKKLKYFQFSENNQHIYRVDNAENDLLWQGDPKLLQYL